MDKISVIVPVYNVEKYLDRCVKSILNQTYDNFEVILIDDGSKDNSGEICERYKAEDDRVIVIHQENQGSSAARNAGLDVASGESVVFIDSDDFIEKDYFEILYNNMNEFVDLVVCEPKAYNPNGEIRKTWLYCNQPEITIDALDERNFDNTYRHLWVWGVLFRRSVINSTRFNKKIHVGEDTLFLYTVLKKCRKVHHINQRAYCYVVYEESACNGTYSEKKYTEVFAWQKICNEYKEYKKIYKLCLSCYALRCLRIYNLMYAADLTDSKEAKFLIKEIRKKLIYALKLKGYGNAYIKSFIITAVVPVWLRKMRKRKKE